MKHKLYILAVFIAFTLQAASAQAGLIEFFFPSLKSNKPDPSQTLVAPFAEKQPEPPKFGEKPKPPAVQPLPENSIPIERPHRSTLQVAAWLATTSAALMTFDAEDPAQDLAKGEIYFDQGGRAQYMQFLTDNNIKKVIDMKKYYVRSFSKDQPVLLNEGEAGGRYHWLFEVPVTVSYMERAVTDYTKASAINQDVLLKVQVGRSPNAGVPEGMVIEHWSGKGVKSDKDKK